MSIPSAPGAKPSRSSSARRSPALPDVPAMSEEVPGYVGDLWVGLFAVALFLGQSIGVASAGWLAPRIGYEALIGGAGILFGLLGAVVAAGLDRRARHAPAGQQS
jgi:hypothetical protein